MYKCLFVICFLLGSVLAAKAQKPDTVAVKSKTDSLNRKRDSVTSKPYVPKITKEKVYHPDTNHSPHTAVIRSLIIPGWGQVYNRKYWKVPIIYGGLGLLGAVVMLVVMEGEHGRSSGAGPRSRQSDLVVGVVRRDDGIGGQRTTGHQVVSGAQAEATGGCQNR